VGGVRLAGARRWRGIFVAPVPEKVHDGRGSFPGGCYQRFLTAWQYINPQDCGIDMGKEAFAETAVVEFNAFTRGARSHDERLLRPRTALHFSETVRQRHPWGDLPDDIILRVVLGRRKGPTG